MVPTAPVQERRYVSAASGRACFLPVAISTRTAGPVSRLTGVSDGTGVGRYPTLDAFIREAWEGRFVANWDANDMLALLETWQRGDVARGESLEAALGSVGAEALVMPCRTDLYFCVSGEDGGVLAFIPTVEARR